jgi:hypothetical protein
MQSNHFNSIAESQKKSFTERSNAEIKPQEKNNIITVIVNSAEPK